MTTLSTDLFANALKTLLNEAYEGPASEAPPWFSDHKPDAGIFAALDRLSAPLASTPVVPGGLTVAAHAEHLRWSLALANAFFRGGNPQPNWAESWSVREVSPGAWDELRAALRAEFESARAFITPAGPWDHPLFLTGTMALLPHAAYHLGMIRQMVKTLAVM